MISEITATHERLSQLKDEFDTAGFTYDIVSVTQTTDSTGLLTDRQRQVMTGALEQGYYGTPRECSLITLADALAVSKSTASVVLHNAEETVIKEFFTESVE
ncbi:helix-turn-helix domain-containing protein [Halocatena marina]|uniref:Helix-turn-helix domain-containing protein n=1 Tax=Halocatena marina TaxID=2934937 RepID=A0ABD5YQ13_9EURY|nr:helix-turn-helix domain-containing protein [Halocatena marina]